MLRFKLFRSSEQAVVPVNGCFDGKNLRFLDFCLFVKKGKNKGTKVKRKSFLDTPHVRLLLIQF